MKIRYNICNLHILQRKNIFLEAIIMDLKAEIEKIIAAVTKDSATTERFKKNPLDTIKELAGNIIPEDKLDAVVDAVKAKLKGENLADNAKDTAEGFAEKAKDIAEDIADKAKDIFEKFKK